MTSSPTASVNPWREAVLDRLAVLCMDAPQDEPPASILHRIIAAEVEIALDPSVSDVVAAAAPAPEPVAEVYRARYGRRARYIGVNDVRKLDGVALPPLGTKLYAAPPAASEPVAARRPDCVGSERPGWKRGMRCATCDGSATVAAPPAAPAPAASVPDGMVMVPMEPTEAMMDAGERAFIATARPGVTWAEHTGNIYRAMIAASPAAPAAPVVPLTDEQIDAIRANCWSHPGLGASFCYDKFARAIEAAHGITGASK